MYSIHKNINQDGVYHHDMKKGGHPRHSKSTRSLMKQLDLSPEQQQKLQIVRKEHFTKVKALKKELFIAQHHLFVEAGNDNVDSAAIAKYRGQMMDIQGKIADESLTFLGEMKKDLTPEQQEMMKQHFKEKYNK